MDATQTLYFIATFLLTVTPQLLVILFGLILCFYNWSKVPKVSKRACAGLVIMLLTTLTGVVISAIATQMTFWYRDSIQNISFADVGIHAVLNILWSVGLGILIYTVWVDRGNN